MFASEHTRLINRFIGLCKNTTKWPSILADSGYEIQLIEQNINLKTAEKIKPDVVAFSNRLNHTIVTDCKSGNNIDLDQDKKYSQLESDDLKFYVTTHDKNQLKHTVCYSDTEQNHNNLKPYTKFPFITFNRQSIDGDGDFGATQLNRVLCTSISLVGMYEPTGYYPFSPEDENSVIAPHVLRGLVSYLVQKGQKERPAILAPSTASDILQIIHPLHDKIETRHKEHLVKIIGLIITQCMKTYPNFNEQITKIERGEFNPGTFRSLAKSCEEIAQEYESQKKITDEYD